MKENKKHLTPAKECLQPTGKVYGTRRDVIKDLERQLETLQGPLSSSGIEAEK